MSMNSNIYIRERNDIEQEDVDDLNNPENPSAIDTSSQRSVPHMSTIGQGGQQLLYDQRRLPETLYHPPLSESYQDMRLRSDMSLVQSQQHQRSSETAPNWLVDVEFPSRMARAARSSHLTQLQSLMLGDTADNILSQHLAQAERLGALQGQRDAVLRANASRSHPFAHPSQFRTTIGASPHPYDVGLMDLLSESEKRHLAQFSRQLADHELVSASYVARHSAPYLTSDLSTLISNPEVSQQRNLMTADTSSANSAEGTPTWLQQFALQTSSDPLASSTAVGGDAPAEIPRGGHEQERLRNSTFPCVLYLGEIDDEALTPYQCCLRKHLELFEADEEDVRNSTRQGRTAPIKLGQIGLRCRHCADAKVAARTKGAAYYSQTIEGLYQIAQNLSKTPLLDRCKHIPPADRHRLITLRNNSRRATGGKEYWTLRIRDFGVYEDPPVLRAHSHPPSTR
jgi:hypothetical protein